MDAEAVSIVSIFRWTLAGVGNRTWMDIHMIGQTDRRDNEPERARHNNIGTLAQQLTAIVTSIYMGDSRGTSAAAEYEDAHRLIVPRKWPEARQ